MRTIAVPTAIRFDLVNHLAEYVGPESTDLVFTGPKGAPLRRGNFNTLVHWVDTVKELGAPGLHFPTSGTPATSAPPSPARAPPISWRAGATTT